MSKPFCFLKKSVELLVNSGADIEARNNDGETPLHIMARRRRLGCAIVLLSRGANVNAQSTDGSTPLHQAAVVSFPFGFTFLFFVFCCCCCCCCFFFFFFFLCVCVCVKYEITEKFMYTGIQV